ncbi:MAG: sulfate ABC transporter ATP-binding protein, partial [Pseudomonadota bacterium]
ALVILDEPTASLDGRAMREIEAILRKAHADGTRLILSTHDMGQARRIADTVVFILGGKVHETGPAAAFFDGPQTPEARAFLKGDIVE